MILLITQNIHVKILKYPQRQSFFFFFFSEAKFVICLFLEIKKTCLSLWKKAKETFIRSRKYGKLKVKLLLQSTVKYFLIYNDFSVPFSFYYNITSLILPGRPDWYKSDELKSDPITCQAGPSPVN